MVFETLSSKAEGYEDWDQCKKNRSKETRWHNDQYARQVAGKAGERGSHTISYGCSGCKHVLKGDFTRFHVEEEAARKKANKIMTGTWCAKNTGTSNAGA